MMFLFFGGAFESAAAVYNQGVSIGIPFRDKRIFATFRDKRIRIEFIDKRIPATFRDKGIGIDFTDKRID